MNVEYLFNIILFLKVVHVNIQLKKTLVIQDNLQNNFLRIIRTRWDELGWGVLSKITTQICLMYWPQKNKRTTSKYPLDKTTIKTFISHLLSLTFLYHLFHNSILICKIFELFMFIVLDRLKLTLIYNRALGIRFVCVVWLC